MHVTITVLLYTGENILLGKAIAQFTSLPRSKGYLQQRVCSRQRSLQNIFIANFRNDHYHVLERTIYSLCENIIKLHPKKCWFGLM